MMYSCHGLMLARQMCACVAEGARAHGLPHLVSFSLSTILSALLVYPQFLNFSEAVWEGSPRGVARRHEPWREVVTQGPPQPSSAHTPLAHCVR